MYLIKNFKILLSVLVILLTFASNAKSTEECFENTSRAIFKVNMAFDDIVFEPLAKGYNKLPEPIKKEQVILHQILVHFYLYLIIFYKKL